MVASTAGIDKCRIVFMRGGGARGFQTVEFILSHLDGCSCQKEEEIKRDHTIKLGGAGQVSRLFNAFFHLPVSAVVKKEEIKHDRKTKLGRAGSHE